MQDFYLRCLERMAKNGILKRCDLSNLTRDYLANQSNPKDIVWTFVDQAVNEIFNEFLKNGHIKSFLNETPENLSFDSKRKYIQHIKISAEITLLGFSFYKEHVKTQTTLKYALIAIIVSIASFSVATFNAIKGSVSKTEQNKRRSITIEKTNPTQGKSKPLIPKASLKGSFRR